MLGGAKKVGGTGATGSYVIRDWALLVPVVIGRRGVFRPIASVSRCRER